jgi:tungstate transport system permease protein
VTTAIALEAAKGALPLPIALRLVLLSSVLVLNALAYGPRQWAIRRYG